MLIKVKYIYMKGLERTGKKIGVDEFLSEIHSNHLKFVTQSAWYVNCFRMFLVKRKTERKGLESEDVEIGTVFKLLIVGRKASFQPEQ